MLVGDWVPRQVDRLDGAEWDEGLLDGVLLDLKVDAPHIDPGRACGRDTLASFIFNSSNLKT